MLQIGILIVLRIKKCYNFYLCQLSDCTRLFLLLSYCVTHFSLLLSSMYFEPLGSMVNAGYFSCCYLICLGSFYSLDRNALVGAVFLCFGFCDILKSTQFTLWLFRLFWTFSFGLSKKATKQVNLFFSTQTCPFWQWTSLYDVGCCLHSIYI